MPNNFTDQETHKRNRIVLPDFDGKLSHKTHKGNDQGQSLFNTLTKAGLDIKNTPNGEKREQMKQAVSLYICSILDCLLKIDFWLWKLIVLNHF